MKLGELLIYRYQLITKDQRAAALARQQDTDRGRRLGLILVGMKLITEAQLRDVLDYQLAQRDPWRTAL